jgi:hypothetical protein
MLGSDGCGHTIWHKSIEIQSTQARNYKLTLQGQCSEDLESSTLSAWVAQ